MKKELHCWDLDLGITEIHKDLARKIHEKLLVKFWKMTKAAKYYSEITNKSP